MSNKPTQKARDNAQQIQVDNIVVYNGTSYTDTRQMMLDLFEMNFIKMSEDSYLKAMSRVKELVNEFLHNLYEQDQKTIDKLQEPSCQYSLFCVEREYAKTGDIELKDRLIELLLLRMKSEDRSLKQIVLDRAIKTLPHITPQQINILTFIFVVENLAKKVLQNNFKIDNQLGINIFMEKLRLFSDIPERNVRKTFNTHLAGLGCIHETSYYMDGLNPTHNIENLISKFYGIDFDDSEVFSKIKALDINLAKWYKAWKMLKTPLSKLTTIGLVIAITHYNQQTKLNINLDDFL